MLLKRHKDKIYYNMNKIFFHKSYFFFKIFLFYHYLSYFCRKLNSSNSLTYMRIKEIIKEKGVTAKEVARRMGVKPPHLSRAINENTTVETLKKIAAALDVPIAELFEKPANSVTHCPYCGKRLTIEITIRHQIIPSL